LSREGGSLAVVDETGSLFYLAGGSPPFGRYPRVFINMYNKQNERRVTQAFIQERPHYVLARMPSEAGDPDLSTWTKYFGPGPRAYSVYYADTYTNLLSLIHGRYQALERVGPYELWEVRAR
jgi:hypothetical protein